MTSPSTPLRLITISVSHYCEKARWAMERLGVPFVEERHVPLVHMLVAWRRGGRRTLPVLIAPEGVYSDSTDILHYLDDRQPAGLGLYPAAPEARREAEELEELFDTQLGPHTRRWAYFYLLDNRSRVLEMLTAGVGATEAAVFRALFPGIRAMMRRGLRITPASAERSRQKIASVFDSVSKWLADGRRYLAGDRFSAADLSFAALAAPVLAPPEYGLPLPPLSEAPEAMRAQVEEWRRTPAGGFALRLYREERRHA